MIPNLAPAPVLETPRLLLRAPERADMPAFLAYATSARTRFVGGPKTPAAAVEKFAGMIGQWVLRGFGRFVLVERAGGAPIGHAGPLQMDESAVPELTWSLWSAQAEGRGLAREAAQAVATWVFGPLGLPLATTVIHRDNLPSHAIAARIGGVPRPDLPGHLGPDFVTYHFGPQAQAQGGLT